MNFAEVLDESRRNAGVKRLKAEAVSAKKALEVRLWLERNGLQRDVAELLQSQGLHAAYASRRDQKTSLAQVGGTSWLLHLLPHGLVMALILTCSTRCRSIYSASRMTTKGTARPDYLWILFCGWWVKVYVAKSFGVVC